ncbi:MAG: TlpA disulfide reductase family protein [Desulfoplanes sp.]
MRTMILVLAAVTLFVFSSPTDSRAEFSGMLSSEQLTTVVSESSSRVVVVNFWATWCGPCRQEFPALMSLRDKYSSEDLLLVGISLDYNADAVKFFADQVGFNYPVYLDAGDIANVYNVTAIPRLLVFADGKLQGSHVGYVPGDTLDMLVKSFLTP